MLHAFHDAPGKYILAEHSEPAPELGLKAENSRGGGQPLYSRIKIPGGWTTMEDIEAGAVITAFDGTPGRVMEAYQLGKLQLYRITFMDGRYTDCGVNSLWKVFNINTQQWRIISIEDIIKILDDSKNSKYILYIDLCLSEQINNIKLPVSPYTFGAIIGNESIFNISSIVNNDTIKLLGLSGEKYDSLSIPEVYLYSSHHQRLALLRGLLDTNGIIVGDIIQYDTINNKLAQDISYLARSLGNICKISNKLVNIYYNKQLTDVYVLNIKSKDPYNLFISSSRKDTLSKYHANDLMLRIVDIHKLNKEECKCIQMDHQYKMYITDDFIVMRT